MPPGLSGPHIWRFFDFGGKLSSSLLHSSHFLWRRGGAGSGRQARSNGRRTRHEAPPSKAAARGRRAGCGAGAVQARQEFKVICAVAHSRRKARSAARRQLAKQRAAAVDAARITRVRSVVALLPFSPAEFGGIALKLSGGIALRAAQFSLRSSTVHFSLAPCSSAFRRSYCSAQCQVV